MVYEVPVVIRLVPNESSYQFNVFVPEAVSVTLPDPQTEAPVVEGAAGLVIVI